MKILSAIVLFLISYIFISCSDNKESKLVRVKDSDGEFKEGLIIRKDSVFTGRVKFYTASNQYYGYMTYENGISNGPSVCYYGNGKISDSMNLKDGFIEGMAYRYDSTGKLNYKCNYYKNRVLGHNYIYDNYGNITSYYFLDFEGNSIFGQEVKINLDGQIDTLQYGDLLYSRVRMYQIKGVTKSKLFLYLMNPPFTKIRYSLAIVRDDKNVISSTPIESDQCFYEVDLRDNLEPGTNQAIIYYVFNPKKQKEDLFVSVIKDRNE